MSSDNIDRYVVRKQLRSFIEEKRITPDEAIRFLTEIKELKKGFSK